MKNKQIKLSFIALFSLLLTAMSCSKNDPIKQAASPDPAISFPSFLEGREPDNPEIVAYYSAHFMNDADMALVFEKFMGGSINIRGAVLDAGGADALSEWDELIHGYSSYNEVNEFYDHLNMDTLAMKDKHAEALASWLNLLVKNPEFNDLSRNDQELVLDNLQNTLSADNFEAENPDNILVGTVRGVLNANPDAANRSITMGEATSCVIAAVAGQFVNGWGVIKELVAVINGTNLGWSGIKAVCGSALSTIMGSNVAGMAINFGICMALAYIF
jgi:hypothetical protein